MIIVGGGLAGLLAANMMSHHQPVVYESQKELPNNHSAVLRFRQHTFSDVVGIPFQKVQLIKAVVPWLNPVADALAYSEKNIGVARSDRSTTARKDDDGVRYIAPPDLIQQLAKRVRLRCGATVNFHGRSIGESVPPMTYGKDEAVISTIPMPVLMEALTYPHREEFEFSHSKGVNLHALIENCDAYVGLSFPDRTFPFSRISITGNQLIVEGKQDLGVQHLDQVASYLGMERDRFFGATVHEQAYAKINPVNDAARKAFILWATMKRNIYSLGRFATWRPGLLLDDLVQDVRLINGWVTKANHYDMKRTT